MRPNLLNKFRGILLMKNPLNGRESGSIQQVLELRGIKTQTGFLNARQIAMPQDGTDARKTVVKFLNQMLHRLLLKSTCRNAQRPEESCQYGYCKLENLIPFLLVLFCHNLFCFKRLIILIRLQCHRCRYCLFRQSVRQRCCHPWYRRQKEHCPWQAFS